MAAITSAVIAGAGLAYGVYSSEEQKQQARLAGQEADRQEAKMKRDKKNQEGKQKAERERDQRLARQKKLAGSSQNKDKTILGGAPGGGSAPGGTTGGGGTSNTLGGSPGGKTLLGV